MKTLRKPLFLAAITLAGQLYAQPQPAAPATQPMSATDMANATAVLGKQVTTDLSHIQVVQSVVRQQKDSLKLGCVNEQALAAKVSANLFDAQVQNLNNAVNDDSRTQAFAGVTEHSGNVHSARVKADGCVGVLELSKDGGSTRPQLQDNPTQGGTEIGNPGGGNRGGIEAPGYKSPYR